MRGDRVSTPQLQSQLPEQPQQPRQPRQSRQPGHQPGRQPAQWPAPVLLPGAAYPDWEAIYSDNVGRIYRLMFSKVGNRPDAEDLTSQVFLTAYGPMRTTAGVAQVRAYLMATARTVLAEHWRRTLGHQVTEINLETTDLENYTGAGARIGAGSGMSTGSSHGADTDTDSDSDSDTDSGRDTNSPAGTGSRSGPSSSSGPSPSPGSDSVDERAARILEALPQRQRQILVLRFLRGYTIRQAAAELGVTIANAKVLQHRALKAAARMENARADDVEASAEAGSPRKTGRSGKTDRSAKSDGELRQQPKQEMDKEEAR